LFKDNSKTKNGKQYFFKIRCTDINGSPAQKKPGRFATRKEAETEEFALKMLINTKENLSNITFEEVMNLLINLRLKKLHSIIMVIKTIFKTFI